MITLWLPGNRFELLENGDAYFPCLFERIAAAEREVLLETFILFDDAVGRALRDALLQAAGRGAEIHVLVDGWGSAELSPDYTRPLLEAGVHIRSHEPTRRLFGARTDVLRRMHRKLAVVDGRHAFVGGINLSADHRLDHGAEAKQDYAVRIEGPLVGQIQAFCRASVDTPQPPRHRWLRLWRRRQEPDVEAPAPEEPTAAFVTRDNHRHRTDIERQYRDALRGAQHRVLIASAYFLPGYRLLQDLRHAARRGVQVDLVLQGRPDLPWAQSASALLYRYLIRAGVRVHEFRERPLHAKVAVIDDRWATIGSSNLDPTSLGLNLEANVFMRDAGFARRLRQTLEEQLLAKTTRVRQRPASRLASAWIALRTTLVFHALRRFPVWLRLLPRREPRVKPLRADAG